MNRESEITTIADPQKSDRVTPEPSVAFAWPDFARLAGRALIFFSLLPFLLSGYLAFAHYWVQTQWTTSEATVLSGEFRQSSSPGSTTTGSSGASSSSYFVYCTVSYPVAGEPRHSQLDLPASSYRIDAQAWAASCSPGRRIAIRYKSSDPSKIRLAENPAELTATGSLRVALYFLAPGLLLILTSRSVRAGDCE